MTSEIKKLHLWVNLYKETMDAGLVCSKCCISRPALRKWVRRYEQFGEDGLTNLSRRPHKSPKRIITDKMMNWIIQLRREENLEARRIQNELKWLFLCKLSLTRIHKILQSHEVLPLHKTQQFRKPKRYSRPILDIEFISIPVRIALAYTFIPP